ncbi:molybdopterin molybdenumtransferase MoeA [Rhodanobacter sp. FW510-R12]|uniref:molybdopterin molybdotransferase MoeA n=1 Tax=unclassified Rhodanobacter TaxID=2621553 RepID=UPI0007AA3EBF|nr:MULTISPECIES: gephyrin-like molybdotransferase Glp [unclassified Rhodanobacter]KZC15953.1 molybdopterin molybdenumtransferase MoeA [Rhodanobacter sp. FW104-R8]KZC28340.1 molybdopterin molybdenumtransferase MoeA [Rhodanobacter sp. FW510-T8]KZC32715.1 molybdopterin molybdenumtransferase MoeA [Rhodanobacter sp. FW510-R10]
MIGYYDALAGILARSHRLETRDCPSMHALEQVLARPVVSPTDLPPFDNTAMDGFALCAGGARLPCGSEYVVAGAQAAGDAWVQADGGAWEIMTGACLPAGMDTVVPVELVEVIERNGVGRPLRIRLGVDVEAGEHVRRRGEDVPRDAEVMAAGELLQAQHLALLAALGIAEVAVVRRPRVALICTGRELVDDPAQPLQSGQIRNSNGPFLAARIASAGADVVYQQTVGDEPSTFLQALEHALAAGSDVVLSTGAVSMGRHDFVPEALIGCGAAIHFHKVRIRPGKPLLFASLPGEALFFGLPGNPVSSAVGMRFFVEPALRKMLGLPLERPLRLPLRGRFDRRVPLRCFLKGKVALTGDGQLHAKVLPGQESFRILPLLDANAWVVVSENAEACDAGSLVDVYGLGHLQTPMIRSAI